MSKLQYHLKAMELSHECDNLNLIILKCNEENENLLNLIKERENEIHELLMDNQKLLSESNTIISENAELKKQIELLKIENN